MGRTLPTQIQILREAEHAWRGFRRALRKEDQDAFDVVWSYARRHATASSMAARPLPFEAQALSMMVGLQREIMALQQSLERSAPIREQNDQEDVLDISSSGLPTAT
ncbi:MAG: hypothetical protein LHV69_11015 [Elusimicrobia bacterium]|nr:hypothetical protein [Candidatus Obscuribacterium magneticum]